MKRIGFLISVLFHLVLILILINARYPMFVYQVKPQTIVIAPIYPPLKYYKPQTSYPPPPAKGVPILVKPFVIPPRPGAKGTGSDGGGGGNRRPIPGPLSQNRNGANGSEGGGPPTIAPRRGESAATGTPPNPNPPPEDADSKKTTHSRLKIDWDAISRSLGTNGGPRNTDSQAPFSSPEKPTALAFGNRWQSGIPGLGSDSFGTGGGDNVAAYGGSAFFDSKGYDITPWAKRLVYRVKRNLIYPPAVDYGLQGMVEVYLVIEKTGQISTLALIKSSMVGPFDQSAINALKLSIPLPSLPADFPNRNLPAYFIFRFN
jgi:hypothetical protein